MSLKAVVKTLDDVPEEARALYAEKDGSFHLDIEGIENHPGATSLKNALDREKAERIKRQETIDELKVAAAKFKDIDPDKAREALDKIAEIDDKKLISEGKIEELVEAKVERMRTDFDAQIAAKDKTITELTDSSGVLTHELSDIKIFSAIRDEALENGARPEALDDIVNRGRTIWHLVDGAPTAIKVGTDDERIFGKTGDALTIPEWVGTLAAEASHLFNPNSGGGSGGGDQRGGDRGGVKHVTQAQAGDFLKEIADGSAVLSE